MDNEEEVLPGPVILDVVPITCSMSLTRSRASGDQLPDSLSMRLRLDSDIDLRTPDYRSLNEMEWSITLYEDGSGNEFTELHNALGMINYYEEWQSDQYEDGGSPEACHAWANLDSKCFTLLRDMALAGKLPTSLRLHGRGMTHAWEPDGSGIMWDVKAHKNAVISKIEITSGLVKPREPDRNEQDGDALWMDPPKESVELAAMRAMAKATGQVNARLGWIIVLLAAVLLVVILH